MNTLPKYEIAKKVYLGDGTVIVLLNMLGLPDNVPQMDMEQNIYRVNQQGNVMWQITGDAPFYPRTPFTGLWYDENNQLMGYRFDGGQYKIDIEAGIASLIQLIK